MSLFRSAGRTVAGILDGVDEFKSPFKARAEDRQKEEAEKAREKQKAEARRILERRKTENQQARDERLANLPVSVEEAEAASTIQNNNADQATQRTRGTMGVAAGHVQDTMKVAGDQGRKTIDTTFEGQGKLDTTKVSNWANIAVPAASQLIGQQAEIDSKMVGQIMGNTPLVEQLIGQQNADRELARYAIDKENEPNMMNIGQAVLGAGLLFL